MYTPINFDIIMMMGLWIYIEEVLVDEDCGGGGGGG